MHRYARTVAWTIAIACGTAAVAGLVTCTFWSAPKPHPGLILCAAVINMIAWYSAVAFQLMPTPTERADALRDALAEVLPQHLPTAEAIASRALTHGWDLRDDQARAEADAELPHLSSHRAR